MGILPIPRPHKNISLKVKEQKSKRVKSRRYGHLAHTTPPQKHIFKGKRVKKLKSKKLKFYHSRRPTRMLVTVNADVRNDRRGCYQ